MPHALLLSPDDQAVSAITGVLEEMSVTCERPLDGVSAAQKLNSQTFDLVLVDCENLPAAKLIFDVCRRGKNGNNPVPIAIVDGRAGLPTAFRLGAELILTKPVAKDQARTTIRTAVGRVRKDVPAGEGAPALTVDPVTPSTDTEEEHAHAAAAGASSQLTSFADPAPAFVPSRFATPAALSAPALTTKMDSAVDESDGSPAPAKLNLPATSFLAAPSSSDSSGLFEPLPAESIPVVPKPKLPPSDDPVMAELEMKELEESARAEAQPAESQKTGPHTESTIPATTALTQPVTDSEAPALASYPQSRQKSSRSLVALFALVLAVAGFYGAWMYQPGFRALAQPQVDHLLALVGMATQPQSESLPKPAPQPTPVNVPAPAPVSPTDSVKTGSTATESATGSATNAAPDSPATAAGAVQPSADQNKPVAAPAATAPPVVNKAAASKPNANQLTESKKAVAPASDAPLPGESNAVILSSKGAEKRLAHSVSPKYPAGAEGTVVLKEVVDENGQVQGVRLVEGNAALATAATEAVKHWRYRPYVRDGKAQPFQTVVILDVQKP